MKKAKSYVIVTQFIFEVFFLGGLGYFIGYTIDKKSLWPGILASIGIAAGICLFIYYILRLAKEENDGE